MRRLDIAVAGAGSIGRRHIELIQSSTECRMSAIVDPAAGAAAIAASANVPLYPTLAEMFAAGAPDGVVLATPNQLHVDNALECIRAGVGALVEKPVAHTLEDANRLCDITERTGARVLVGHHRAHSTVLATACEIVRQGTLGRLVAVVGSAMFYKPDDYFDEAPWRRQAGGGPILINMIHEIGNLRALCGDIVAVQAIASNATRGFAVEDTVAINFRFANDALGTFMLSDTAASARSWEQTSQENKSYATYPDEDCYVVVGTDGSLAVPTMRLKTYPSKGEHSWWKPFETRVVPIDRADPLERQLGHFCAVLRGEVAPRVTVRDGLQNLRVTEAIAQAARSGTLVLITETS